MSDEAPRPEVRKLMDLADELGLTDMQRKFCEFLAADPERNQTAAAQKAGSGKTAHVQASKWVRVPKVKKYLEALTKTAEELAVRRTGRRIMTLSEALERMTDLAESDLSEFAEIKDGEARLTPTALANAIAAGKGHLLQELQMEEGADKDGMPRVKLRMKLYDKKDALDKLIRHHGGYKDADPEKGTTVNILAVLGSLPSPVLAEVHRALLEAADTVDAEPA